MTAVFLDTVGLLALWDLSDQWHAAAEAAFKELSQRRATLVTTAYILLECGNAAAAGIVDHLSFVVMRRHGIQEAFTNDQHFRAAGFTTLF